MDEFIKNRITMALKNLENEQLRLNLSIESKISEINELDQQLKTVEKNIESCKNFLGENND